MSFEPDFQTDEFPLVDTDVLDYADDRDIPREIADSPTGKRHVKIQWARRLFHMSSSIVPMSVLAIGLTTETVLTYYWPVCLLFVLPEVVRLSYKPFNDWFCRTFGFLMRPHERHTINTAAEFAIAVYLGAALFGIPTMMVAFLCLSFADPVAAIVGLKIGRVHFLGKTLEGFLACAAVCAGIAAVFYPGNWAMIAAVAAAGAIAEIAPIRWLNDNIRIPIGVAAVITLMVNLGF